MNHLYFIVLFFCILVQSVSAQLVNESCRSKEIISEYKITFNSPPQGIPSQFAVDAPLLGNGFTGIAISGKPEKQVYHIARNDFWRLKSSYNESYPAVLGKLEIEIPGLKNAGYLIEQELWDAKTYSRFKKENKEVAIKSFISATEDLLFIEISYSGEGELEGSYALTLPGDGEIVDDPPLSPAFEAVIDSGMTADGISYISRGFEKDVDIASKAACAVKIMGSGTRQFILGNKKPVVFVASFSSNFKSGDCLNEVIKRTAKVQDHELLSIEKKHNKWWSDFWQRSWVDIPYPTIEKHYYQSHYTMASCSRDSLFPPPIFGTWITKERPGWNGDYHLNYNHFAPFYALYSSNHLEQAYPCNTPLLEQTDRGKFYAEQICGIKNGIILPVGIGPLGIETTRKGPVMVAQKKHIANGNVEADGLFFGQKSNSAYAIVNMAKHFYSSYDPDFAREYYPFVRDVANFWEEYLVLKKGKYVIYNDAIHEGTLGTRNPILSLGLVRMVMKLAIDMSSELDLDSHRHSKWQDILENLSDYTFQRKKGRKVFRYSEKGTAWWRNNTLGIQHIYPAGQIGPDSDQNLLEISKNTISVMQRWLDHNGSNSFFPAAVRVGYPSDSILYHLKEYVAHTSPNGFQKGNPHGIENMSTVPNTINEMLCMGHGGVIRVFPVWPRDKDAEFSDIRTHGAFLVSAQLKEGRIQDVTIVSERGKECQIINPWPGEKVHIKIKDSEDQILSGKLLKFTTTINQTITLSKN